MDAALATCAVLPEPDPDAEPLLDALRREGLRAEPIAWDDPRADWSAARLTLLRSTWNYPLRPDDFLAWAEHVASVSDLWNPLEVVRWNLHKSYLLDLASRDVAIAPTVLIRRGDDTPLADIVVRNGWESVVVKPAISAASFRTRRVTSPDLEAGEAHLRELARDRDVLVQCYLPSVEDHGERAIVWVDGALTHAVRKSPRFTGEDESVSGAVPIAPDEAELARRAVASVDRPILYARVDVARGPEGRPVVMELELIEPSLFFDQGPEALDRLVRAVARRLERRAGP